MRVLFLGGMFPPEIKLEIEANSKGVIQNAANALQWCFLKGLDHYYETEVVSIPYLGSYPFLYKKISIPSMSFEHRPGANDAVLGYPNLLYVKRLFHYYKLKKELIRRLANVAEPTVMVVYALYSPIIAAAAAARKRLPRTKLCLIIPDLPEFMTDNNSIVYKTMKKIDRLIIDKAIKEVDYNVLLSDNMANAFDIRQKPWVRIEGIFDQSKITGPAAKESLKTVLYTGTLARRYGVMSLVEAFRGIKSDDYRLWICGEGDARKTIETVATEDRRIFYLGQKTHEEVLTLQKKATVLVNPRTSEGEFTKYSFPSKIMEYYASGTPTIMYRLEGIPEEYFPYCFVPQAENIERLREMIVQVCEKPPAELEEFGKMASLFIQERKNPISQVNKLVEMLRANGLS